MQKPKNSRFLLGVSYGVLAAIIWSAWPVVSRLGIKLTLSYEDITMIRFTIAAILLLPWLIVKKKLDTLLDWRGPFLALGAGFLYVLTAINGLKYAPAAQAGTLIPGTALLIVTLVSVLWFRESISVNRKWGIAVILVGIILLGAGSFQGNYKTYLWGDMMFICAGGLWGGYTLMSRRFSLDPMVTTALVSVWSVALYGPYYLYHNGLHSIVSAPVQELLLQIVFQGVLAGVAALLFFTRSIEILGAGISSLFGVLVPGFALLLAIPVLGEMPNRFEGMGAIFVSLGMLLSVLPATFIQRNHKVSH